MFFEVDCWPSAGFSIALCRAQIVRLTCCYWNWDVDKTNKANPGVKVNQSIEFSCMSNVFHCCCFV